MGELGDEVVGGNFAKYSGAVGGLGGKLFGDLLQSTQGPMGVLVAVVVSNAAAVASLVSSTSASHYQSDCAVL